MIYTTLDTTESKEKTEQTHTEYIELPGLKSPLRIQDSSKYVGEHIITECRNGVLSFLRKFIGRCEDQ